MNPDSRRREEQPEYLSTNWANALPASPSPSETPESEAATLWRTGLHRPVTGPTQANPTLRLDEDPFVQEPFTEGPITAWRGTDQTRSPRKARAGKLRYARRTASALLVGATAAYFLWQHLSAPLSVTQVHVHTDRVRVGCEQTALVTALVRSEGGAGTIRYRWLRSDGNVSGVLRQSVADGEEQTVLPLRWTFHGHGTYDAVAVVEILSPTVYTSSVALTYHCS